MCVGSVPRRSPGVCSGCVCTLVKGEVCQFQTVEKYLYLFSYLNPTGVPTLLHLEGVAQAQDKLVSAELITELLGFLAQTPG